MQWPVQHTARTDAEHEIDVCMQEHAWLPVHHPRLEHGEAQLVREHHARWPEHLPVCARVPGQLGLEVVQMCRWLQHTTTSRL